MATILNAHIKEALILLSALETIITREAKNLRANTSNLDKVVPLEARELYSRNEGKAQGFIDKIEASFYESAVITLVATFENIVFAKYQNSYGSIRTLVRDSAKKPLSYYKSRERLVNDNIDSLSGIIRLIEGHVSIKSISQLKGIKSHRDYIAHGKRITVPAQIDYNLTEIASTLDEILSEID